MSKTNKYFLIFIFYSATFCFSQLSAQNQSKETANSSVTLHRTETIKLTSAINGNTYPIKIALPGSYYTTDKTYPVVYMLDAYSSFGIVTEMARLLASDKELPELILVGISSEGGSKEFIYNRSRDYTPTKILEENLPETLRSLIPTSGGGEKFLEFIKKELIPFVESKYRFKPDDRTLAGHSLGGLFVFYSLFYNPELFNRFVAVSPALLWDHNYILNQEEEFSKKNKSLNAVVYSAVGSKEDETIIAPWKQFISKMEEKNYTGLNLKTEIAKDETHYTIIPYIITHGLKSVFSGDQTQK